MLHTAGAIGERCGSVPPTQGNTRVTPWEHQGERRGMPWEHKGNAGEHHGELRCRAPAMPMCNGY